MKHITRLSQMLGLTMIITVVLASVGISPANAEGGDGEFHFTVIAKAFDYDEASISIKDEVRMMINNAEQVTWEQSNHNIKVTKKEVRKAPRLRTKCTDANRFTQSKQIFKQTDGARIVVLKPGSCAWNRGLRDHIRVGFKWTVKSPAVLVVDRNGRYRHAYNIVNGKLVKTCANYIGGPVDAFADNVVQVQYQEDVKFSGYAEVATGVHVAAEFGVTCPNGAYFKVKASAFAFGYAGARVTFTGRTKLSVMNASKLKYSHDSKGNGETTSISAAQASIDVSGSCGDTPPPSYDQPDVDVTPVACVYPGQTRDVNVTVGNPNAVADTARVTFRGEPYNKAVAANGSVSFTLAGVPAGSYTGTALLVTASKSKSFTVTVQECPGFVDIMEVETVNDVLINNTRTIRVKGVVSPGRMATLFASACNGGSITVNKTQQVSGTFDVTVTYKAGDEVPGANTTSGCEVAAGKERVNFTLTDTVDPSIKDTGYTTFAIVKPIPDPM